LFLSSTPEEFLLDKQDYKGKVRKKIYLAKDKESKKRRYKVTNRTDFTPGCDH
jgi:hypothetical protein